MIVKFMNWNCKVIRSDYANGRTALELVGAENDIDNDLFKGEPVATCTVNIPEYNLPQDAVIIKDYSENEGMLEALMNAGIVSAPFDTVQSGFVSCPVCKFFIDKLDEL